MGMNAMGLLCRTLFHVLKNISKGLNNLMVQGPSHQSGVLVLNPMTDCQKKILIYSKSKFRLLCVLTSEARMEPPIQALNRRSTVVLLAISFSLMLCKAQTHMSNSGGKQECHVKSMLIWRKKVALALTYRRGFLGEFSVQSVCEALNECVSSSHHHTAVQTLRDVSKRSVNQSFWFSQQKLLCHKQALLPMYSFLSDVEKKNPW